MSLYKNILIIGAETHFGKNLTSYLLSQNYYVAVLISSISKWDIKNENLEIIQGDIFDYYSLKYAASAQQVIISALDYKNYKSGEISIILQNILNAISANYVDKYISVVPIGSGETKEMTSSLFKLIIELKLMKQVLNEYSRQATQLSKTNIDYTIIQTGEIYDTMDRTRIVKTIMVKDLKSKIQLSNYKVTSGNLCHVINTIMNNSIYRGKTVIVTPRDI